MLVVAALAATLALAPAALAQEARGPGETDISAGDTVYLLLTPTGTQTKRFVVADTYSDADGMQVIVNEAGKQVGVAGVRIGNGQVLVTPAAGEPSPAQQDQPKTPAAQPLPATGGLDPIAVGAGALAVAGFGGLLLAARLNRRRLS